MGPTRDATDGEQQQIEGLARDVPVAVFGALNQRLNRQGYCLTISALADADEKFAASPMKPEGK
jgi:hypothetical protein